MLHFLALPESPYKKNNYYYYIRYYYYYWTAVCVFLWKCSYTSVNCAPTSFWIVVQRRRKEKKIMLPLSECLAFSHVHVWPSLWLVVCPCLFPIRWSEEKIEEEKRRKRKDNKKENYSKFNKITIRVFCVFIWIRKKGENARSEADRDQETADASDRIVSSVLLCLFFKKFHFSRERVKLGAVQIGSGKTPSPTDWRKGNQSVSEITDCGRPLWLYAQDRDTLRCEISFFSSLLETVRFPF